MIDAAMGTFGSIALLLGLGLATIGLYGMLRHPDLFEQLHAAGLVTGPAAILVLAAALASGDAEIATSAVLVVVFILVTASLSTHVVALAGWRRRATGRVRGRREGASAVGPMRLLVAHDGSTASELAIALAGSMQWPEGILIRVVGVTEGDLPGLSDIDGRDRDGGGDAAGASPALPATVGAAAARVLEGPGRTVEHVLRAGDPSAAILDEAEALDAQLVIMGSRGQGRLRSFVAGSVVSGVLDGASCPVLIARTSTARRVLLATDGSDASMVATDVVAHWPSFAESDIAVISVAMPAADASARTIMAAGRRAVAHTDIGEPADRIVEFATAQVAELIVLGSRGNTGVRRTLLGSVGREVLAATQASVLVVRSMR